MPGGWWVKFHREVWDDADFKRLGPEAKLIFLWAWTNPSASNTGLVRATYRSLARAMHPQGRVTDQKIRAALKQLAAKPLVLFDPEWSVLLVPTRTRWVLEQEKVPPRAMVAMLLDLEEFPQESPLVKRWRKQYAGLVTEAEDHRDRLREWGRRGGKRKPDPITGGSTKPRRDPIAPKVKKIR